MTSRDHDVLRDERTSAPELRIISNGHTVGERGPGDAAPANDPQSTGDALRERTRVLQVAWIFKDVE
jgi:hypothetical protein